MKRPRFCSGICHTHLCLTKAEPRGRGLHLPETEQLEDGGENAARRQIKLYEQAEARGPAYRGGLRETRRRQEGVRASRLGTGQRDDRRRPAKRIRPGREGERATCQEGRPL